MDHGTVEINGIEITLTQEAYCHNNGQYLASGKDEKGNTYLVEWETTKAWDDAQEAARNGDCSAWAEEESNACDWNSPIDARLIESAE